MWADHIAARPATAAPAAVERQPVSLSTPIYGPFIWLIVLLPLLSVAALFLYQPRYSYQYLPSGTFPILEVSSVFTPGYFAILLGSLVVYGLNALFAFLDRRRLVAAGIDRPFSWPWIFLSAPVYVIGRSVIVHRVARPRGLVPVWVLIGVFVVSIVATLIWTVLFTAQLVSQLPLPSY